MTQLAAIDPGTTESALLQWDGQRIQFAEILPNVELLACLRRGEVLRDCPLWVEQVESYGMAVGREVFATVWWAGRFHEAHEAHGFAAHMMPRRTVKLHLCGSARAKDPNIRQSLVDRFGEKGTKKAPGALYGVRSHLWAALGLAVTAWDAQDATHHLPDRGDRRTAAAPLAAQPTPRSGVTP
ncbi:MAG: hypothetical protein ACRD4T_00250 [Candidatus Acidiferrales bacterium]